MATYKIYPPLGVARIGNGPVNSKVATFTAEFPWQHFKNTSVEYLVTADDLEILFKSSTIQQIIAARIDNEVCVDKALLIEALVLSDLGRWLSLTEIKRFVDDLQFVTIPPANVIVFKTGCLAALADRYHGAVKKQAQRFHIYECDDSGVPTKKLDMNTVANLEWHVDVANKKAFWYDYNNALDMSLGEDYGNGNLNDIVTKHKLAPSLMAQRRNPNVIGNNFRQQLVIRSEGSVGTDSVGPVDLTGKFPANVPLGKPRLTDLLKCETRHDVRQGTIECDTDGSLIFYAGDGVSKALTASSLNTDFADNSNWYDDICDGQVTAKFTLKNSACEVSINNGEDAAWIATAPVDYAPQIQPLSTLYDMVSGASEDIDSLDTQFSDVFPILYRLYRMQWVNQADFADNSLNEALSIIDFKTLVDNQADAAVKQGVFKRFRNPLYPVGEPTDQIRKDANGEFISNSRLIPSKDSTDIRPTPTPAELLLPYYPGDGIDYPGSPMQWFAIPPFMYKHLENWSKNAFATVTSAESEAAKGGIESLADFYHDIFEASEHKALLSARAALDSLYGGGFHPGVELTWPMRRKQMYLPIGANIPVGEEINLLGLREFRINAATSDDDTFNDFGRVITGENVKSSIKGDPDAKWLWESTPGDLTKWMGIPWQSDAASCQLVYAAQDFPIPAWWAANLPVTVLPAARYEKFKHGFNPRIPQTQESYDALRISQFSARQFWLQTADTGFVGYHAEAGYTNGLIAMVNQWKNMGMVMARPGTVPEPTQPQASSPIPKVVYVSYGVNDKDIAGLK